MTQANLEVVFDHLNARRSHDLGRIESQLDPNVVHQGVLPELVCNNRKEVLENVRRGFARDGLGVDRLEMIDAGNHVVVGLAGPRFRDVPWAPLDGQIAGEQVSPTVARIELERPRAVTTVAERNAQDVVTAFVDLLRDTEGQRAVGQV